MRELDAAGWSGIEAGPGGAANTIVLLHGFPDFWYGWRLQIPALVGAGFRVIAPDLPGYLGSAAPSGGGYGVRALAAEVARLIQESAPDGVVLVGHDWGGVLAWRLAASRPDLVRGLVILNAPHPAVFGRLLFATSQLFKSWYAFFFQLPWLPERWLSAGDFAVLERIWRASVRGPGAPTDDAIARYKTAFGTPGTLSNALAYYRVGGWRVMMRGRRKRARSKTASSERAAERPVLRVPTLVVWGEKDPHLDVRNLDGLERHVACLTIERLPHAAHWVQLDAPERVNELLITFARDRT